MGTGEVLIISIDSEVFLITRPRRPWSEMRTLEPLPKMVIGTNRLGNDFFSCSRPSVGTSDDCARKKTLPSSVFEEEEITLLRYFSSWRNSSVDLV